MEFLHDIFQAAMVQRIGWTLVHFVWQAAAIGIALAIALKLLRKSSADLRYAAGCMAMVLIVIMPAVTISQIDVSVEAFEPAALDAFEMPQVAANTVIVSEMGQLESLPAEFAAMSKVPLKDRFIGTVEPALPYMVIGWLAGVFGLSLWHLGGWGQLQKLRRQMVKQVAPAIKAKLRKLADALAIQKAVDIVESALVSVPMVVGHLKPVILLPASALTGLSTEQIEAILAHELAHIKRCDYLVNMLQTVVEILGFYHPAVWWVSRRIRLERENCCDDIAVSLCSDRVCYARALATMEEIRSSGAAFAMAASGGSLLMRIKRLVGKDPSDETKLSWLPSAVAMVLITALLIPVCFAMGNKSGTDAETTIPPNVPAEVGIIEKSPVTATGDRAIINLDCIIAEEFDDTVDRETFILIKNLIRETTTLAGKNELRQGSAHAILNDCVENEAVSGEQFSIIVDMLISRGYLKILVKPTLETFDEQTAKVTIKGEDSTSDVDYVSFGLKPTLGLAGDGTIVLDIDLELEMPAVNNEPKGAVRKVALRVKTKSRLGKYIVMPVGGRKPSEQKQSEHPFLLMVKPTVVQDESVKKPDAPAGIESGMGKNVESVLVWPADKAEAQVPSAFKLPANLIDKALERRKFPIKIYADNYYYYVIRDGLYANSSNAEKYGVRIDGVKAHVCKPEQVHSKYSLPKELVSALGYAFGATEHSLLPPEVLAEVYIPYNGPEDKTDAPAGVGIIEKSPVEGVGDKVLEKADIPATSTISELGHIVDKIDYPFVDDPEAIGRWKSVDFVRDINSFDPAKKGWSGDLFLKELFMLDGGKTNWAFGWTRGLILHHGERTASKYFIKEIDGVKFMFFEWKSGDYTIRHRKPSYYVLRKDEDMVYIESRTVDKIDYPFVDDKHVIGTWESVDFVSEMEQFKVGEKRWKGGKLFLNDMIFEENGKLTCKNNKVPNGYSRTWTKGLVINKRGETASRYHIKEIDGATYMFYEWKSGDYTIRGMKPKYYVLKKTKLTSEEIATAPQMFLPGAPEIVETKSPKTSVVETEDSVRREMKTKDITIFESYFPDDQEAGKELTEWWDNKDGTSIDDDSFFDLFRKGLRTCTIKYRGNFPMQHIGGKYIWRNDPDNPQAIDIVYHASFSPEFKYYAVYSGLSVANPKSERVIKRLVELAMEPHQLGRIIWGVKQSRQEDEFMTFLEPYLQSLDLEKRQHAEIVEKTLKGEIDAGKWEREYNQKQKDERTIREFSNDLPRIRKSFLTGTSKERLEAIKFINKNLVSITHDESFIQALSNCAKDKNSDVRAGAASILGGNYIRGQSSEPEKAIEILLQLSQDEIRQVRYKAVYFGLSVVGNKDERIIKRLVDMALDETNDFGRISWGLRGADKKIINEHLKPYLDIESKKGELAKQLYKEIFKEKYEKLQKPDDDKRQIAIEARILIVDETFLKDIGFDFKTIQAEVENPDQDRDIKTVGKYYLGNSTDEEGSEQDICSGQLDDLQVKFILKATQEHGNSKVLTTPRINIYDGEEGTMTIAKEVAYISGYNEPDNPAEKPEPKPEYIEEGVKLSFLPAIIDDDNIEMHIDFTHTELLDMVEQKYKGKYPYKLPTLEKTAIESQVVIPAGSTIMLGGIAMQPSEKDGQGQILLLLIKPSISE